MAAEIVFSGGACVQVPATDAVGLINNLNRVRDGVSVNTPTGALPAGWVDVATEAGVIYVNPAQVAYVRDTSDMPQVEETPGSLSGLQGAPGTHLRAESRAVSPPRGGLTASYVLESLLAPRGEGVAARRNGVLVPDPAICPLRDELAAALIPEVSAGRRLSVGLGVVMRTRARRAGLIYIPAAVGARRHESSIRLCHRTSVPLDTDELTFASRDRARTSCGAPHRRPEHLATHTCTSFGVRDRLKARGTWCKSVRRSSDSGFSALGADPRRGQPRALPSAASWFSVSVLFFSLLRSAYGGRHRCTRK